MPESKPVQNPLPPEGMIIPTSQKKSKDLIEDRKFEEAMAKQRANKTDTDQKNQRKQEQEETEGVKKVIAQDIELAEKTKKSSVYDVQTPKKIILPPSSRPLSTSKQTSNIVQPQDSSSEEDDDFILHIPDVLPLGEQEIEETAPPRVIVPKEHTKELPPP